VTAWLGVVSAEHVRRGVAQGIAQIGHGKRTGLARMRPGDTLIYYSAQERLGGPRDLRQFTALGIVADDEIWQVDEDDFRPHRRRVDDATDARPVALDRLGDALELTAAPNWGQQLRRGLVVVSDHDAAVIRDAMMTPDDAV